MIKDKITILGLGYVGLPLAIEFSKKFNVVGFDISKKRIADLNSNIDKTDEVDEKELEKALDKNLLLSNDLKDIQDSNIYIITVPTPITKSKKPDLSYLKEASKMVGKVYQKEI